MSKLYTRGSEFAEASIRAANEFGKRQRSVLLGIAQRVLIEAGFEANACQNPNVQDCWLRMRAKFGEDYEPLTEAEVRAAHPTAVEPEISYRRLERLI